MVAPGREAAAIAQDRMKREALRSAWSRRSDVPFAVPGDPATTRRACPFPRPDRQSRPARLATTARASGCLRPPAELDEAIAELAVPCVVEGRVPARTLS